MNWFDNPDAYYGSGTASPVPDALKHLLTPERKAAAIEAFNTLAHLWATNFGAPGTEQPDRVEALRVFGSSKHMYPFLHVAYEKGSLQALVREALSCTDDLTEQIASNMIQVAHAGFPDLFGTYDYTNKWRAT